MALFLFSRTSRSAPRTARFILLPTTAIIPQLTPIPDPNLINHQHLLSQFTQFSHQNPNYNPYFQSNLIFIRKISTFSCASEEKKQSQNDGELLKKGENSWIYVYLPRQVGPFAHLARLDKPIGTWLLAWPCMWKSA